jgi:predicted SnoaL-like aldol condensation-catalyzing enzyme
MKFSRIKLFVGALTLLALVSMPMAAQNPTPGKMSKQEAANLKLVLDWWLVLQSGHAELVPKYMAPDVVQHNPNFPSGAKVIQDMVARRKPVDPMPTKLTPEQMPEVAMSRGDIVFLMFNHEAKDPRDPSKTYHYNSFDSFRVKDGKIVDHWDGARKTPPRT